MDFFTSSILIPKETRELYEEYLRTITSGQKLLLRFWCEDSPIREDDNKPTFCYALKDYVLQGELGRGEISDSEYEEFTEIFDNVPSLPHDIIVFRGVKPRWVEEFYSHSMINEPYPISTTLVPSNALYFAEADVVLVYYITSGHKCLDVTSMTHNEEEEILHLSMMNWRKVHEDDQLLPKYKLIFLCNGDEHDDTRKIRAMKERYMCLANM